MKWKYIDDFGVNEARAWGKWKDGCTTVVRLLGSLSQKPWVWFLVIAASLLYLLVFFYSSWDKMSRIRENNISHDEYWAHACRLARFLGFYPAFVVYCTIIWGGTWEWNLCGPYYVWKQHGWHSLTFSLCRLTVFLIELWYLSVKWMVGWNFFTCSVYGHWVWNYGTLQFNYSHPFQLLGRAWKVASYCINIWAHLK